jgi:hypothetical protein
LKSSPKKNIIHADDIKASELLKTRKIKKSSLSPQKNSNDGANMLNYTTKKEVYQQNKN